MPPRESPYRPGGRYRPTSSFISSVDTFQMGEVLTFVEERREPGRDVTSYVFADAAGALRTFDVADEMPSMALYLRFRAVDPQDAGCPACRNQRYRGKAACLEELGHGEGPTIYYRCRRCTALWEENTREIHVVLDQLLTCPHLQALERDLRSSGVRIALEDKDWDNSAAGFWVYFGARIEPVATRAQFNLPEFVEYYEWNGRVAGQEAGFTCTRCHSAVMGVHPAAAEGIQSSRPTCMCLRKGQTERRRTTKCSWKYRPGHSSGIWRLFSALSSCSSARLHSDGGPGRDDHGGRMSDALTADVDRALEGLREAAAAGSCAPQVAESLQRQLEWCRDYLSGLEVPKRPGPFSMGLLATRELDMYGDRPDLAALINAIEAQVHARMNAGGDAHALAAAAYEVADLCRAGKLTRKQALMVLRKRFPRVPDDDLERAFSQGLFESR
jgi:hypothetical protein